MTLTKEQIDAFDCPYKEEKAKEYHDELLAFLGSARYADQKIMCMLSLLKETDPLAALQDIILTSWHMGLVMGQMKKECEILEKMI